MLSKDYVTKRQSLRLLGELLLDRANFNVMTKFIGKEENLKLMMKLLVDKSKNIQFEAFHVFKVFVANPNKTQPIKDILRLNQETLLKYLSNFHNNRGIKIKLLIINHLLIAKEDEQFLEERSLLITEIRNI